MNCELNQVCLSRGAARVIAKLGRSPAPQSYAPLIYSKFKLKPLDNLYSFTLSAKPRSLPEAVVLIMESLCIWDLIAKECSADSVMFYLIFAMLLYPVASRWH